VVLIRQELGLRGLILHALLIAEAEGPTCEQLSFFVAVLLCYLLLDVKLWLLHAGPEKRIYRASSW
jgi:hypothetical protein